MEQVIAYVFGAVASISAVGAFIARSQSITKYLSLASEVIQFVDELVKAVSDKTLSEAEIKRLAEEAKEIKEAYNIVKKK